MTHAIPPSPFRHRPDSVAALRYASADALRTVLADIHGQARIERKVLWWAVSNGRRDVAIKQREQLDYYGAVERNAHARLRQMEGV